MPSFPADQQVALGITPPVNGQQEKDPKTKVKRLSQKKRDMGARPRLNLSEDQALKVKKVMKNVWAEWEQNTSNLRSKLRRNNDLMEGIKAPKIFPWQDCSNLHIPVIEIHITILHSVASQTMLENDPIFYVKVLQDNVGDSVDTDIEQFLHWDCKINMKVDNDLSDIYWNSYRDGTSIGVLDWVEEYDRVFDIRYFSNPDDFMALFPTAEEAGLSEQEYENTLDEIHDSVSTKVSVPVKIEETLVRYRGPKLRVVELKDFVVIPTTAPTVEYAMFVGDLFLQRNDYFKRLAKDDWFDKDEVEKMVKQPGMNQAPDAVSQSQDQIEGIARTRVTMADEHRCLQGILKIDLSEDDSGVEKKYLITHEKMSDTILRIEEFPYIHNRCNYIVWRFKRRPGRLLGQSIPDQLVDINEEVDTQHNQRVDSRTITTVPSFIQLDQADFDPTRRDQRFFPGVTFKVSSMATPSIKQFEIKQTDMGQSLQEEQNLMSLADTRTGASQLRGGPQNPRDPRAPAKKIALQIQQSGIRVDDHMRELRIGTAELGNQVLELRYQYSPEMITFNRKDPATGQFVKAEVLRSKLRSRGLFVDVARTSIMDNPNAVLQEVMTMYELMMRNPLVATNALRIREVSHRLLKAMRTRDADKIIPPLPQLMEELKQQSGMTDENQDPTVQNLGLTLAGGGGRAPGPSHAGGKGAPPKRPQQPARSQQPVQ